MYKMTKIEPGMKFGRLTVLERDHTANRKTYYRCLCECGKECVVSGHHLTTGKTRSCGCLRGDSVRMVRGRFQKVEVSERTKKWILKHYCHTKNADIKAKYGLTDGWLHRFARANGLKKTPQFMHKVQKEASEKARISHIIHNSYPPKGHRIPGSEKCGFQKGVTPEQRLGKRKNEQRIAKAAESRRKTWKLEHARKTFGLPQETKLRVVKQPRQWALRRWKLRKMGYVIERGGLDCYYTDETRRSERMEANGRPFRFHALETCQSMN